MGRMHLEPHAKRWETWSLRLEVSGMELAGHKTAALALACFDAAIEGHVISLSLDIILLWLRLMRIPRAQDTSICIWNRWVWICLWGGAKKIDSRVHLH